MEIQSDSRILAKSIEDGGISLLEHTCYVVESIELFAKHYNFDLGIARNGAILLDLGKAHPYFQKRIHKEKIKFQ